MEKKKFLQTYLSAVAYLSVLNIDGRVRDRDSVNFDSGSSTMVYDNSANVHVCNQRSVFDGDLTSVTNHTIATIGGRDQAPSGIGRVRWSLQDNNVIYEIEPKFQFGVSSGVCS